MSTIPSVGRVRSGKVSEALENIAQKFLERSPGYSVRYVYDPKSRPELSNVLSRSAEGYEIVKLRELSDTVIPGYESLDDPVRAADLVLMKIPTAGKERLRAERAALAAQQVDQIDRRFHEAVGEMEVEGGWPSARHRPRPIGTTEIKEVSFEYEREQRETREEE